MKGNAVFLTDGVMAQSELQVKRLPQRFVSDDRRVITRFFDPGGESRIRSVVVRVLGLTTQQAEATLAQTLCRYNQRHRDIGDVFLDHFKRLAQVHNLPQSLCKVKQMLIGAYFTMEYSVESAALFNPSIVPAANQEGIDEGDLRFILSLRATGEGHKSSIVFRTGVVQASGSLSFDTPSPYLHRVRRVPNESVEEEWLRRALIAMDSYSDAAQVILDQLGDTFTLGEIEDLCHDAEKSAVFTDAAQSILWICHSNYTLALPENTDPSEIVIFPTTENEQHGIEDARFVQFYENDGSTTLYGTFTAVNGSQIQCQLMEIQDFRRIRVRTLHGYFAQNKGLALFPRRIQGLYAMLSRVDGENNYVMCSTDITCWENASLLQTPQYPWEFMQIGNCGSPLETEKGWLMLTHGVGPMREYCIGACLLEKEDPTKVIGTLREPLIVPAEDEREGYVPNVVYSCGALIHNGELIIPYAMADSATSFAAVSVDTLLSHLLA
ncbi:glycoside hydrolase family 130 protein [Planctomycetota bacterium]